MLFSIAVNTRSERARNSIGCGDNLFAKKRLCGIPSLSLSPSSLSARCVLRALVFIIQRASESRGRVCVCCVCHRSRRCFADEGKPHRGGEKESHRRYRDARIGAIYAPAESISKSEGVENICVRDKLLAASLPPALQETCPRKISIWILEGE